MQPKQPMKVNVIYGPRFEQCKKEIMQYFAKNVLAPYEQKKAKESGVIVLDTGTSANR